MFFSIALITAQHTVYSYLLILFINFLPSQKCKAWLREFRLCTQFLELCLPHSHIHKIFVIGKEQRGREKDDLLCLERVQQTRLTNYPSLPSAKPRNIPIGHPTMDQPTSLASVTQGRD